MSNENSKAISMSERVDDNEFWLNKAKEQINKLNCELKGKQFEINEHVRRWQFYEQIIKNLTTFK